jgi:hypothetical protein
MFPAFCFCRAVPLSAAAHHAAETSRHPAFVYPSFGLNVSQLASELRG